MRKELLPKKDKNPRKKRYYVRKFIKEIKRVKWPDSQKNVSSLLKIILFTLIIGGFVIALTYGFSHLWAIYGLS
ncbi:preprotein translocase subunit SecE [Mycoplasmopsis sturni]|uniref:preprotein translocase subunit SecE n=1 Tax=Mycoplasmopsis sturni TaxID=39047 RepID=UPI00068F844A|nr:preprotein translocase subunit SecE [Mycoplasmopsis sturni]